MPSTSTALLIIDAQQSFQHRPYWHADDAPAFYDCLQTLVNGAKARQVPIVQIFHVESEGAFSLASGYVKTLAELSLVPDAVFHKQRHGRTRRQRLT